MVKSLIKLRKLLIVLTSTLFITILIGSCISKIESKPKWLYVNGSSEIPLFSGLEIIKEETTSFDSLSGNINSSSYKGYANLAEVEKFYDQTLTELGWKLDNKKHGKFSYQRAGDKLEINFKKQTNGMLYINFLTSSNSSE